jgi:hypothetical protein
MITWFNAPNEGLSPGGQLTLKTLTATENKTYQEDGTAYTSVTVNVEGGGGSSDFSTATLTVNDASEAAIIHAAIIFQSETEPTEGTASTFPWWATTCPIILYKGVAVIEVTDIPGGYTISTSGSIEDLGSGFAFVVTGDCTITIS